MGRGGSFLLNHDFYDVYSGYHNWSFITNQNDTIIIPFCKITDNVAFERVRTPIPRVH